MNLQDGPDEAQQLRDLLALTRSVLGSAQRLELDPLRAFVDERGRLLRRLHRDRARLTNRDLEVLRTVAELGDQARLPLAAKRENLRREISELRKSRQARESLKPFRETRGLRLDVQI